MLKFICPDCEELLVQHGPRWVCPKALKNAVRQNGRLVAPPSEEHPRFKLWTVGELVENRLYVGAPAEHADDIVTLVAVA